jgi:hypothetical protein
VFFLFWYQEGKSREKRGADKKRKGERLFEKNHSPLSSCNLKLLLNVREIFSGYGNPGSIHSYSGFPTPVFIFHGETTSLHA